MMPTTAESRALSRLTAAGLLAVVEAFAPGEADGSLVFDRDPPTELLPLLRVLHTGIRAVLTGRRWYGCGDSYKAAAARPLNPCAPIPREIALLAVEGDERWDRIDPAARLDLPGLFASSE